MSCHRERMPGAWALGSVVSAEEINAIERTYNPANRTIVIDRRHPDVCHHCGAPSPGDVCRYCNTAHRRTT